MSEETIKAAAERIADNIDRGFYSMSIFTSKRIADLCSYLEREIRALLAAERKAALEEAIAKIEAQAKEIAICARTYEQKEPGQPRESMLREANHWWSAAGVVRALAERAGWGEE